MSGVDVLTVMWDSYPEIEQCARQEIFDAFLDFVNGDKMYSILEDAVDSREVDRRKLIESILLDQSSYVTNFIDFEETESVINSIAESNLHEFYIDPSELASYVYEELGDESIFKIIRSVSCSVEADTVVERFCRRFVRITSTG